MKETTVKKVSTVTIFISTLIITLLNIDFIIKGFLAMVILVATMVLAFSTAELND